MIESKTITIETENNFNLGYALCRPASLFNPRYDDIARVTDEIVSRIRFAEEILLILSGKWLSTKMLEELDFVSDHTQITLICKNIELADELSENIRFKEVSVRPDVDFNYLRTTDMVGRRFCYSLEGRCQIDDDIEAAFFSEKPITTDLSVFNKAEKVMVVGDGTEDNAKAYNYCKAYKIKFVYVADAAKFSEQVYDETEKADVKLYMTTGVMDGIYVIKKGTLFRMAKVNGALKKMPVMDIKTDFGERVYLNVRAKGGPMHSDEDLFVLAGDKIIRLDIKDTNEVRINVDTKNMEDFISENFDRSESKDTSKYSGVARFTRYIYTLNPPRLKEGEYKLSEIYLPMMEVLDNWSKKYERLNLEDMREKLVRINGAGILREQFGSIINCKRAIDAMKHYNLRNKSKNMALFLDELAKDRKALKSRVRGVVDCLLSENFRKLIEFFDSQIKHNRELIEQWKREAEDEDSLFSGSGKITAKENENDKLIRDKLALEKQHNTERDAEIDAFLAQHTGGKRCYSFSFSEDGEVAPSDSFGGFLEEYYDKLDNYYEGLYVATMEVIGVDVPEDYVVCDCGGKRYIQISDISEYEATKEIREKYSLECVAEGEKA